MRRLKKARKEAWARGEEESRSREWLVGERGLPGWATNHERCSRQQYTYPACRTRQEQYIAQVACGERTMTEWGTDVDDREIWEYSKQDVATAARTVTVSCRKFYDTVVKLIYDKSGRSFWRLLRRSRWAGAVGPKRQPRRDRAPCTVRQTGRAPLLNLLCTQHEDGT